MLKSVFSGFGGQGVLMMGYVLATAGMHEDKHVTFLPAYGAEVRGGTANCTVVVSDEEIASPVASSPEIVVAMNYPSLVKYQDMIKSGGVMFLNSDLISDIPDLENCTKILVPANSIAHDMGNDRVLNMVMLGAMNAFSRTVGDDSLAAAVETVLAGKKALVDINRSALTKGAEYFAAMA